MLTLHVWRSSLIHHECDILSRTKCKLKANTKASIDILWSAMSEGKEKTLHLSIERSSIHLFGLWLHFIIIPSNSYLAFPFFFFFPILQLRELFLLAFYRATSQQTTPDSTFHNTDPRTQWPQKSLIVISFRISGILIHHAPSHHSIHYACLYSSRGAKNDANSH